MRTFLSSAPSMGLLERVRIMFVRSSRGQKFYGMDSHVLRPMMAALVSSSRTLVLSVLVS